MSLSNTIVRKYEEEIHAMIDKRNTLISHKLKLEAKLKKLTDNIDKIDRDIIDTAHENVPMWKSVGILDRLFYCAVCKKLFTAEQVYLRYVGEYGDHAYYCSTCQWKNRCWRNEWCDCLSCCD